tara:strand:+ start:234 stop:410 length:177 start_codon:yes stop_codon:yes gene_type:complete
MVFIRSLVRERVEFLLHKRPELKANLRHFGQKQFKLGQKIKKVEKNLMIDHDLLAALI